MQNQVSMAVKPVIDFLLGFRYRLETGAEIDVYALRSDIHNALQSVDASGTKWSKGLISMTTQCPFSYPVYLVITPL